MAFAVDDIVTVAPADRKHPAALGAGYGRIVDIMVNNVGKFYHVAVAGVPGFVFKMEESDLVAFVGQVSNRLAAQLPAPKKH